MTTDEFTRTQMLLGEAGLSRLKEAKVAVFGVGGVGGHAAEGLARSGVGHIALVDNDVVSITNINRQLVALHSTVGLSKVSVMAQRIWDINPQATVEEKKVFYLQGCEEISVANYDYIIDAVDTVSAKLALAKECQENNVPIISAMGCGNRLDPGKLMITDIYKTWGCPLCKVMRKELRNLDILRLDVVYSREEAVEKIYQAPDAAGQGRKAARVPGSVAFVPSVAGLMMAGHAVMELVKG